MKYWKNIYKDTPKLDSINTKNYIKFEPMFFDSETSKITHIEKKRKKNKITNKMETVNIEVVDDTWVYLWMCSVGDKLYYGRYLHEFFEFLRYIVDTYGISPEQKIDIWVHNLSYDISYMYDLLVKFNGGTMDGIKMLCSSARKFITYELENIGITFKCTYRLTNRSLDKWCKDLCIKHKKQTGTKAYDTTYMPWDKLPQNEYKYGAYDIISLKECFYKECEVQGYTYATIPLTMTGFVRRDFQNAYTEKGKYGKNRYMFQKTRINDEQYQRLLRASGGGMVQGNYTKLEEKVYHEAGIGHLDFESHYPVQMRCNLMPYKPFTIRGDGSIPISELDNYADMGYYYVVDIVLANFSLKEGVTAPFMYESKCTKKPGTKIYAVNGKIIQVEGEVRICCTNFDIEIFRNQYNIFEHEDGVDRWYQIIDVDVYDTDFLPDYVINTIDRYYKAKSETKMLLKKDPENNELKAQYNGVDKPKLNGIFGCAYTKVCRNEISMNENFEFIASDEFSSLDDYYERYNSCMAYQWGCFVCALGRFELYTVISSVVGYDAFLYCDTDSVFYKNSPEIEARVVAYRKKCRQDSIDGGFFITLSDGSKKYYHDLSPEDDHLKSKTFKVLHAKCYALEPDGELRCTIAGVSAKNADGTITREQELGSLDEFKPGKTFYECGGTRADYTTIRPYEGYTGGGCAILDNIKTLGGTLDDEIEEDLYE